MPSIHVPLQTYQLRARQASPARLINCFIEQLPTDAATPIYLSRAPGVAAWTTVGNGAIRGMHYGLGKLYVVSGTTLFAIDANKTATNLGTVGAGEVDMADNGTNVVVVTNPTAYYTDGVTLTQITDADFTARGAGDVEFQDGYLLFREPDSARFFASDLNDATSYDSLQFSTADGSPDDLVGMKVDHRQVILFGDQSTEIWENTGASGFPFERAINGYIEKGCLNGKTAAKLDNTVFWVADDYTVRRLDGLTPVRISTHAIEQKIFAATASTGRAFTYSQDGHLFYVVSFAEGTYVYDATTGTWHERQTYAQSNWSVQHHAQAFGLELVGNSRTNEIGYIDPSTYTEFGSTQRMEWTYQPIYSEGNRAFHRRIEMQFESGTGLTTGQGSDPEVMLDVSDDAGKTWRSLPNKDIGKTGEYEDRAVWHALGSSRQRVYRGSISDPVQVALTDTVLDVDGGRV